MTHQELDDIFRANSERGEFAPQPGEWEEMTAMLDEDERKERHARWVSIGWMSLFILLICAGVYGLWSNQSGVASNPAPIASVPTMSGMQASTAQQAETISLSQEMDEEQPSPTNLQSDNNRVVVENLVAGTGNFEEVDGASQSAFAKTPNELSSISTSNKSSNNVYSNTDVSASALSSNSASKPDQTSVLLVNADLAGPTKVLGESAVVEEKQAEALPILSTSKTASTDLITSGSTLRELASITLNPFSLSDISFDDLGISQPPPPALETVQSSSKIGFGLFLAEEITSVAMSTDVRFGTRFGGQFHYRPFDKWSIDLGVSYARKTYVAPDGEMKNTLGLFVDEALPVQTDGQCDILEIPLTVTYLTQGHGNAGAFVSGGLLSYHIFREEMVFHWDDPSNQLPGAKAPQIGSLLGTAHLQAGYRFVPKSGPVWRVGPYLQVPITMVGSGKLPLYSGGLQIEVELF